MVAGAVDGVGAGAIGVARRVGADLRGLLLAARSMSAALVSAASTIARTCSDAAWARSRSRGSAGRA